MDVVMLLLVINQSWQKQTVPKHCLHTSQASEREMEKDRNRWKRMKEESRRYGSDGKGSAVVGQWSGYDKVILSGDWKENQSLEL